MAAERLLHGSVQIGAKVAEIERKQTAAAIQFVIVSFATIQGARTSTILFAPQNRAQLTYERPPHKNAVKIRGPLARAGLPVPDFFSKQSSDPAGIRIVRDH